VIGSGGPGLSSTPFPQHDRNYWGRRGVHGDRVDGANGTGIRDGIGGFDQSGGPVLEWGG
jgi:hypothetical protein